MTSQSPRQTPTCVAYADIGIWIYTYGDGSSALPAGSALQTCRLEETSQSQGHHDPVSAVAISPDGRLVVSIAYDGTMMVWDIANAILLRELEGLPKQVRSITFSPDGQFLVLERHPWPTDEKTVIVWDLQNGKEYDRRPENLKEVTNSAGTLAITVSADFSLSVWELPGRQKRHTLRGHTQAVSCVSISPDGRQAVSSASGAVESEICVWDLLTGQLSKVFNGYSGPSFSLQISHDGRWLVDYSHLSTDEEEITVWDLVQGELRYSLEIHPDHGLINLILSPDNRFVFFATQDHALYGWDLHSGKINCTFHNPVQINCFAVAPDGKRIVAGDIDGKVHFIELL